MSKVKHLGLIMDGNRRWAKKRGLTAIDGHRAGYDALKKLISPLKEQEVEFVTLYAFSTENWNRKKEEVDGLMKLFRWVIKHEVSSFSDEGFRVVFIGSKANLPNSLISLMEQCEQETAHNEDATLGICFNYSGQQELVDAAVAAASMGDVSIDSIASSLYHPEIPNIDLLVRTSGERRLSNFMLWRSAYAELHFSDTLWPDFAPSELNQILDEFSSRERRFGV